MLSGGRIISLLGCELNPERHFIPGTTLARSFQMSWCYKPSCGSPGSQLSTCAGGSVQRLERICLSVPTVCMSHVEMLWASVQWLGSSLWGVAEILVGGRKHFVLLLFALEIFPLNGCSSYWIPLVLYLRNWNPILEERELLCCFRGRLMLLQRMGRAGISWTFRQEDRYRAAQSGETSEAAALVQSWVFFVRFLSLKFTHSGCLTTSKHSF